MYIGFSSHFIRISVEWRIWQIDCDFVCTLHIETPKSDQKQYGNQTDNRNKFENKTMIFHAFRECVCKSAVVRPLIQWRWMKVKHTILLKTEYITLQLANLHRPFCSVCSLSLESFIVEPDHWLFPYGKTSLPFLMLPFLTGRKRNLLNKIYRKKNVVQVNQTLFTTAVFARFSCKTRLYFTVFPLRPYLYSHLQNMSRCRDEIESTILWNIRKDTLSAQGQRWFWSNIVKL